MWSGLSGGGKGLGASEGLGDSGGGRAKWLANWFIHIIRKNQCDHRYNRRVC